MSVLVPSPRASSATKSRARVARVLSLVCVAAWCGSALAEETAVAPPGGSALADTSKPVMFLKETVVTGARYPRAYYESPQALSFVSRTQLREQVPTATGDVLTTLPGVDNSVDSPWEQRPVLRGLGGQRVLVLVDGMPMNSARGNGPHPSLVDPAQVERIEVVRGPSSVAYGSDALGGVINIITREASFTDPGQRFRGAASIGGSTADEQGAGYLELMPRIGKLSAFVSTGMRQAGDFRSANGDVPNSEFKDYNALANLRYDFTEKTSLKLGWQLYRGDDIGIPGLSFAFPGASQAFDFSFYNRDFAHLTFDHGYRDSWLAGTTAKVYWQQERRNFYSDQQLDWFMFEPFGLPAAGPPTGPSDTASAITLQDRYLDIETYGFQTQLTSVRTARTRFTLGVDAARDVTGGDNVRFRTYYGADGNPVAPTAQRITASLPEGDFDNYGAYGQSEWYLNPRWTVHLGGRYAHYRYRAEAFVPAPGSPPVPATSVDDDALSGSAGVVWSPVRDLHVSAIASNGYRQPNAQDLFFNGAASVGFVLGNPALDPERSQSYDLGLRWGPGTLGFAGNLFYSTYEDLIDALPLAIPGPPTYQYTNISEARIWGYEAEAEWRFLPQWNLRGSLSDAIGDITSAEAIRSLYFLPSYTGPVPDQSPLPNVPPIRGTMSVRWSDAGNRFWIEPSARWSWRTSRLPLPTPGVPEFTTFKKEWLVGDVFAGASLPWRQKLVIGVRNFTDTPYRRALASVDDPGINVVGQLTTEF